MTAQDRAACKRSIMQHEGFSPRPVPDAHGSLVLGYGWNPVFTPMTEPQALYMLDEVMDAKERELRSAWPQFVNCDGPRQRCLVEMTYQLGVAGVLGFTRMLHAISLRDYATAAREVLDSTLAQQTPSRARDYAQLLTTDTV